MAPAVNFSAKALGVLLASIILGAFLFPLGFASFNIAFADDPVFKDHPTGLNDLTTELRYVPVSSSSPFVLEFKVTDPGLGNLLDEHRVWIENPPDGLSLTRSELFGAQIPHYWKLEWDTSSFAVDPNFNQRSFIVTINAVDIASPQDRSSIKLPFILFNEDRLSPALTLDKESYFVGETVYVTLFDLLADKDGQNAAAPEPVSVERTPGTPITLQEVNPIDDPTVKSGTFRGTFVADAPFFLSYGSVSYPTVDVMDTGVKFEREKYSNNTSAKILVYSRPSVPAPTEITLNGENVEANWVPRNGGYETDPPIALTDEGENSISVSIDGVSYGALAEVAPASAEFVNPISGVKKSSYYSNETAGVVIIDHQMNQDKTKAELISGSTNSGVRLTAEQDEATAVPLDLLETGADTGVFAGVHLIGFTNDTNSDAQLKLLKMNPEEGGSTRLELIYSSTSGSLNSSASLITAAVPEEASGIGSTTGVPMAASSIVPVTNLSCSSYGGDVERDGICDAWEGPTRSFLTIPYGGTNHVFYTCNGVCPDAANDDIFLEIDTLNGQGPSSGVMSDVANKFEQRGYILHYEISDNINIADFLINMWVDPSSDANCGNLDSFREIKMRYFGTGDSERLYTTLDTNGCEVATAKNKGLAKFQVYHYCLYGKTTKQNWSTNAAVGTSGLSESIGNDCAVTLGAFPNVDAEMEKGTLLHELGHNFGLRHGGGVNSISATPLTWIADSNANCKPNYISPMSYSHQFPNAVSQITLDNWVASYSNYALTHYDVFSPVNSPGVQLNEDDGPNPNTGTVDIAWMANGSPNNKPIASTASGTGDDVDWDGDGDDNGMTWNNNINNFGFRDCNIETDDNAPNGVIRGFKDWNKLVLEMRVYGGSNWAVPGQFDNHELDELVWTEVLKSGIKVINTKIQGLDETAFSNATQHTPDEIKEGFAQMLIGQSGGGAAVIDDSEEDYTSNSTTIFPSSGIGVKPAENDVTALIGSGDIPQALDKLFFIASLYDGRQEGGDPSDDLIVDKEARDLVYDTTKGNIRTLIRELYEQRDSAYSGTWTNGNDFRVMLIASSSVNSTEGRSFVHEKNSADPSKNSVAFKVKGGGDVSLELERGLVNGSLTEDALVLVDGDPVAKTITNSTISTFFGSHIEFTIADRDPTLEHEVIIMHQNIVPEFSFGASIILLISLLGVIGLAVFAGRTGRFGRSLFPQ
jgi:hypothetical protein